jgi:hypothetical protein
MRTFCFGFFSSPLRSRPLDGSSTILSRSNRDGSPRWRSLVNASYAHATHSAQHPARPPDPAAPPGVGRSRRRARRAVAARAEGPMRARRAAGKEPASPDVSEQHEEWHAGPALYRSPPELGAGLDYGGSLKRLRRLVPYGVGRSTVRTNLFIL